MKIMNQFPLLALIGAGLAFGLVGGCATKDAAPKTYTFFPPAPDQPRIQFLTEFNSDADLGRGRSFYDYVTGVQTTTAPLTKPYVLAVYDGKIFVCDTVADMRRVLL